MPTAETNSAVVLYQAGTLSFDEAVAASTTSKSEFNNLVSKP